MRTYANYADIDKDKAIDKEKAIEKERVIYKESQPASRKRPFFA